MSLIFSVSVSLSSPMCPWFIENIMTIMRGVILKVLQSFELE